MRIILYIRLFPFAAFFLHQDIVIFLHLSSDLMVGIIQPHHPDIKYYYHFEKSDSFQL